MKRNLLAFLRTDFDTCVGLKGNSGCDGEDGDGNDDSDCMEFGRKGMTHRSACSLGSRIRPCAVAMGKNPSAKSCAMSLG